MLIHLTGHYHFRVYASQDFTCLSHPWNVILLLTLDPLLTARNLPLRYSNAAPTLVSCSCSNARGFQIGGNAVLIVTVTSKLKQRGLRWYHMHAYGMHCDIERMKLSSLRCGFERSFSTSERDLSIDLEAEPSPSLNTSLRTPACKREPSRPANKASGFIPFAQFKQLLLRFVLVTITQWLVFEIILFTRFTYICLVVWGIPQVMFPFTRVSQDSKPPKALTFRWTRVYHTKYHQHQYHSIIKIQ